MAGQTIAQCRFDPILALFDSSGNKIGEQDDARCSLVVADSVTGRCYDTYFTTTLAAGTYTASVQQYDNFAYASLTGGFSRDGDQYQNLRNGFVDAARDTHTALWAFDILNESAAALPPTTDVPEPASLGCLDWACWTWLRCAVASLPDRAARLLPPKNRALHGFLRCGRPEG
ncbi:MAG: DVUA0089 family protein [Pseudomonadota bacterium]|nr:DVUA0089 family protein [Pseudomonadota bacterium]